MFEPNENQRCCLCDRGKADGVTKMSFSEKTGNALCIECAHATVEMLDIDEELMAAALMESFLLQKVQGMEKDANGECTCPRHVYNRLKRERDGTRNNEPAQAFIAEPVSNTRH